ncbi:hypothetical protein Q668_21765 [Alcanivorax sp. PN-3]|nr:hypothetical protein Q668_21765 [Alcanivorax sp. PN-3]
MIETPNAVLKFAEWDHNSSAGLTVIDVAVGDLAMVLTRLIEQGSDHTGHSLTLCGVDILLR